MISAANTVEFTDLNYSNVLNLYKDDTKSKSRKRGRA